MANKWIIGAENAGQRLDVFLTEKLAPTTRSAIAKRLKAGVGAVNAKIASVHTFLKNGDIVTYDPDELAFSAHKSKKGSAKSKVGSEATLPVPDFKDLIIKETPDWIVIDKPTGLVAHPDANHPRNTLADLFVDYDPSVAKICEDPARPGIVHRLDKEASGLMVLARTQDAFDSLKKQFAAHTVNKKYLAMVYGAPPADEGDIKFRIARSTKGGRMASHPVNDTLGKAAWSHYKVVRRDKNSSLLEVEIFSGRTHQIRAHLHALDCPIVGDPLYVTKNEKYKANNPGTRLMLQSVSLEFEDPKTGERISFSLPPDKAFSKKI